MKQVTLAIIRWNMFTRLFCYVPLRATRAPHNRSYLKLAVFLIVVPLSSFSADNEDRYRVHGLGVDDCSGFVESAEKGRVTERWFKWNQFRFYTLGYLTGVNEFLPETYDIKESKPTTTGTFEVMDMLERYCRDHPDQYFHSALVNVVKQLHPTRSTKHPNY